MKKTEAAQYEEIRAELAKTHFKGKCFVCHRKYGKGFQFHHLRYLPGKKDARYKDYPSPLIYMKKLKVLIGDDPARFMLLCKPHHNSVTGLKRWSPPRLKRLLKAVRMTE